MVMKNISVFISSNKKAECDSSCCKQCQNDIINFDLFQYATGVICEEYNLINYNFEFEETPINRSFIKKVLQYEKNISRKKAVKFHNTIRVVNYLPQKSEMKFCKKHKISLDVIFTDAHNLERSFCDSKQKNNNYDCISVLNYSGDDIIHIYDFSKLHCKTLKLKQTNLPTSIKSKEDTTIFLNNLKKLFDIWILEQNGVDIKPISDHIRNNFGICVEKECVNSSCLGKALVLDSDGLLRMCPYSKNEAFVLGNIKNISLISEVYNGEKFNSIVSTMISKRKICMKNCNVFNYCQSGCCADIVCETFSDYYCEVLKELDSYICNHIQRIIHNDKDLTIYNPALANIIRDVICYNPVSLSARTK